MAKKRLRKSVKPARTVRAVAKKPLKAENSKGLRISVKNFVLFLVLFFLSVILGLLITNEVLDQLFWILAILTGFVAVAFLLIILIFLFIRAFKK